MFASCGANVNVEHGASFAPAADVSIGDNSGIGLDAFVLGPVFIGRNVMMGPNCTILGLNHEFGQLDRPMLEQGSGPPRPPIIEDDVWIGANVTILPGRRIGTGAVVGAGAVVTSDVPAWSIVGGNPARVLQMRKAMRPCAESSP
jgi:maltose O-acetyltransferase